MRRFYLITVTLVVYAAVVAGVVWAMFDARARMVTTFDTPQEQANWEAARDDFDERFNEHEAMRVRVADATHQPIAARPPKERSPRPPALELLQNHFAACLATTLAGVTLLFTVIWGLSLGAILRPGRRFTSPDADESVK